MLVLSRRVDESIEIETSDGLIRLSVVNLRGDRARLGIDAPRCCNVRRGEIALRIAPEPLSTFAPELVGAL